MATLNNAPFGKFGTCVPGGAAIPLLTPSNKNAVSLYHLAGQNLSGMNIPGNWPTSPPIGLLGNDWDGEAKTSSAGIASTLYISPYNEIVKITGYSYGINISVVEKSNLLNDVFVVEHLLRLNSNPDTLARIVTSSFQIVCAVSKEQVKIGTSTKTIDPINGWVHIVFKIRNRAEYEIWINGINELSGTTTELVPQWINGPRGESTAAFDFDFAYSRLAQGDADISKLFKEAEGLLISFGQSF